MPEYKAVRGDLYGGKVRVGVTPAFYVYESRAFEGKPPSRALYAKMVAAAELETTLDEFGIAHGELGQEPPRQFPQVAAAIRKAKAHGVTLSNLPRYAAMAGAFSTLLLRRGHRTTVRYTPYAEAARVAAAPRQNPVPKGFKRQKRPYREYDQAQLFNGILVEMEHTSDWDTAKRIAAIHLDERPDYYVLLERYVEQKFKRAMRAPRDNPGTALDARTEAAYRRFHGTAPTQVQERRGVVSGTFHELGRGVDVGYAGPKGTRTKTGRFVHDFKSGVVVMKRGNGPKAVSLNPPEEATLNVAGRFLGLTYRGADGKEHELRGAAGQQLCWDPTDPQIAYVVDSKGILFVISGGYFRVDDWLYN